MDGLRHTAWQRFHSLFLGDADRGRQVGALITCHHDLTAIDLGNVAVFAGEATLKGYVEDNVKAGKCFGSEQYDEASNLNHGLWLLGDPADVSRFESLAVQVARAGCRRFECTAADWVRFLFSLSWKDIKGCPLVVHAWTRLCNLKVVIPHPSPDESLASWAAKQLNGGLPFVASSIPDLFTASVHALDYLLLKGIAAPNKPAASGGAMGQVEPEQGVIDSTVTYKPAAGGAAGQGGAKPSRSDRISARKLMHI